MTSEGTVPTDNQTAPSAAPHDQQRLSLYLLPLIAGPLLLLVVAFWVIPTPWFVRLGSDPWLIGMGYGATLHHVDCEVVVFGDSAAMVGVDPGLLSQRTGLRTCNIAENAGSLVLNGTLVLDQYLSQNAPPRYLIFLFAPEDLDLKSEAMPHGLFEGITYRLRQPHTLGNLLPFLRHPDYLFKWISTGLDVILRNGFKKRLSPESIRVREINSGQFPITDPVLSTCDGLPPNIAPDQAWINELRWRYSSASTTVLVDAMPVPDCDPSRTFLQQHLAGVVDNRFTTFPISSYRFGGRHVNASGSVLLTNMIAGQIAQLPASTATGGR